MQIIRDLSDMPEACKGAVLALGNFDGVHLGHQAILARAKGIAIASGKPLCAMTFEPHPREFFDPKHEWLRIYSFRRKAQLMKEAGVKYLFAIRFNQSFAATSAPVFIHKILHEKIDVSHVITGYNFNFGKDRGGDTAMLAAEAKKLGFGYTAHNAVLDSSGQPLSSSRIRSYMKTGEIKSASAMLGRIYAISGHVIHGDKRGRNIGFPTANIKPRGLFLPRYGVYAVRVTLPDGSTQNGVANLGVRPTFDRHILVLEVHLLEYAGDLYGKRLDVELMDFIREEKRFPDMGVLQAQIAKDAMQARVMSKYWSVA